MICDLRNQPVLTFVLNNFNLSSENPQFLKLHNLIHN